MRISILTYMRMIEGISRHNNLRVPVEIYDVVVDNESIQVGPYYFKKIDLEVDLRQATKAYMSGVLYSSYVDILNNYYADN